LIQNSPATGYRVAQGIGKPTANVYKAIATLENKGALLIEDSRTRLCRAVPVDELLDTLEQRFREVKRSAAAELARLSSAPDDTRVYHLTSSEQVFERLRRMLATCRRTALLDLFPHAYSQLRPDIAAAAARGIQVTLKVYQPVELPGIEMQVARRAADILAKWPGQWANGVVDGREHVVAYLSTDGVSVSRALWSCSPMLAMLYYNGFINELAVGAVEAALDDGADITRIRTIMIEYRQRQSLKAAGYRRSSSGDDLAL
jgi:sugar-specific transcriptional regulator TrmB